METDKIGSISYTAHKDKSDLHGVQGQCANQSFKKKNVFTSVKRKKWIKCSISKKGFLKRPQIQQKKELVTKLNDNFKNLHIGKKKKLYKQS